MTTKKPYNIIVILGPTATGKTKLAVRVADLLETEIISADSRQVYKRMNIGTGKDLDEYFVNNKEIKFHLIDIVDAGSAYNLNHYLSDFNNSFGYITGKNKIPVLCGGSGLYIDAVLNNYEFTRVPVNITLRNELQYKSLKELNHLFSELPPTSVHAQADTSTHKRMVRAIEIALWLNENNNSTQPTLPQLQPMVFGLTCDREIRRKRIEERLISRLSYGLIEEVKDLLNSDVPAEKLIYYGLEYKLVTQYLQKQINYEQLVELLTIAIQQFAKRQMTFFRKMEKSGLGINWINSEWPIEQQIDFIKKLL